MGHAELAPPELSPEDVNGVDIGHGAAEDAAGAGWERAARRRMRIGREDGDMGVCSGGVGLRIGWRVGGGGWGIGGKAAATVTHFWLVSMLRLRSQTVGVEIYMYKELLS